METFGPTKVNLLTKRGISATACLRVALANSPSMAQTFPSGDGLNTTGSAAFGTS